MAEGYDKMNIKTVEAIIEGVLFAAGDAVKIDRLSDIAEVDTGTLVSIVNNISDRYETEKSGLMIIRLEDSFQMCTRPEYQEYISRLKEPKKAQNLSNAALEVLAVIAYRQPVTRGQIEAIRGVSSDSLVSRLVERGLVCECGRLDAPGRPILFSTTEEFLRCFNLSSLTELPDYSVIRENSESIEENVLEENMLEENVSEENSENKSEEEAENFVSEETL